MICDYEPISGFPFSFLGEGGGAAFDLFGSMDGSDADGFYDPAADFAQIDPGDSVYVDIDVDPFEAAL